jgi:hypothetical protein
MAASGRSSSPHRNASDSAELIALIETGGIRHDCWPVTCIIQENEQRGFTSIFIYLNFTVHAYRYNIQWGEGDRRTSKKASTANKVLL